MNANQGHTIKYLVILIVVFASLVFASSVFGKNGSEGQNGQSTNAQQDQDQKQQEPPSALPASQQNVDAFKNLQKIALQRESVISNNVLAHQAKVAWEAEQIYVALREVLSYTMPSMVGDLDQWRVANIPAVNLGNPGELQGLNGGQIDLATVKDPNWKDILGNQNALYLKQKEVADRQFSSHSYEIMWLECYRQFLTRLAEVLRPQPAAAPASSGGYSSGGGGGGGGIDTGYSGGTGGTLPDTYIWPRAEDVPSPGPEAGPATPTPTPTPTTPAVPDIPTTPTTLPVPTPVPAA